ncbi:telomere-associated protein Tap [Streptomyces sp. NPDC053427]|uniref:telomere-associated protein Tap n=1 Tax=Streptomyces sp. NPDC053427 TaxID=3365701 RepID=UPI0037D77E96
MSDRIDAINALIASQSVLPPPGERERLRKAHGLTLEQTAEAVGIRKATLVSWEKGRTEPRPPQRDAYAHLLAELAKFYPPDGTPAAAPDPVVPAPAPAAPQAKPAAATRPSPPTPPTPPSPSRPASPPPPASPPSPPPSRPAAKRPAPRRAPQSAPVDPRFMNGPLAVVDVAADDEGDADAVNGPATAYCVGGVVLECPATTLPALVEWTLKESGIGGPRLHRNGKDSDPLIVLTEAAAERFGLPAKLEGPEARRSLRLPEDHRVVKQLTRAKWKLTRRGFGPWARVYRPAAAGRRQCVQLAILSWDALDSRAWGNAAELPPWELARVLGIYADRVLTPRGSTAVCGLELMTALRPPTRAVKEAATGAYVSGPNPGALTRPVDPAPPEAPPEHPVAQGWDGGFLDEEAYQWVRDPQLLTDEECLLPWAVGIDINTAFLAAVARLPVGLGEPVHVRAPGFDQKIPGSWLVDLSHIALDPRLPSPFTPSGERPTGPAWYATPTVAYATQLGHDVAPIEAYLRDETGPYLDPWHDRLKDAYVATMADLGVPVAKDLDERAFLTAMEHLKSTDPGLACVLSAVKSTVKGGIGKLRERPQGRGYRDGERWPALERPTWRPDIRAAVIAKARVNMHRKMLKLAELTGRYPLGVLSDCVVYASAGPTPLDVLPRTEGGRPNGTFRLGATPGLAKHEGTQEMPWVVDLMERGFNPARHIKGDGHDAVQEGE